MVQGTCEVPTHPNLPEALVLLTEMNSSAQHVATLVEKMIEKVHQGEISTDQGLSFLEMKYNMLLNYLINLSCVVLRKCSGERIEGDPCIERLVEIRTFLEKIRPIDRKLKYQIDKLVKSAVVGVGAEDPTAFKANPTDMVDEGSSGEEQSDKEGSREKAQKGVYVPPKLSAVHYTDVSAQESNKRNMEKNKKMSLSSALMQDLREEYLDTPVEITQGNRAQQVLSKQQQERRAYEEEYMTRLPVSKSEKQIKKQLTTLGTLGDEITNFGGSSAKSKKRKFKSKGKYAKRRRTH